MTSPIPFLGGHGRGQIGIDTTAGILITAGARNVQGERGRGEEGETGDRQGGEEGEWDGGRQRR